MAREVVRWPGLFKAGLIGLPLVICGVLKITYDLLLLQQFRNIKPEEEQRPCEKEKTP